MKKMFRFKNICNVFFLVFLGKFVDGYPEPGKWNITMNEKKPTISVPKSLFENSDIIIQILCKSPSSANVTISWALEESACYDDIHPGLEEGTLSFTVNNPNSTRSWSISPKVYRCEGHIPLTKMIIQSKDPPKQELPEPPEEETNGIDIKEYPKQGKADVVATVPNDGFYVVTLSIIGLDFEAQVHVEMKGPHGYLSAVVWPLLPFYALMCSVHVVFGVLWLVVSFWQWRDLLRIQFWIGGVILLGMLEKATFYAEYYNINSTGLASSSAVLAAEWVSCAKRTLARMLVIIVSLGFGIVRPRLGSMLHRVVAVGGCYLLVACIESYIRVFEPTAVTSRKLLLASIPLAALDSLVCWWIFTALVQTTRQLRMRRFTVKLALYRHFTNTLIFAVLTSVIFMLYSIKVHRFVRCLKDWKELWVDDAFWHLQFSLILVVIMVLWRPTNNNQRYAFTPLLDNPEDEDEEEDQFVNESFGVKMRTHSRPGSPRPKSTSANGDDEILKWVEDNIPSAGIESTLPILDSDEELESTRFHVSKMN